MEQCIDLPASGNINLAQLLRAIGKLKYPDLREAVGIDCVTSMRIFSKTFAEGLPGVLSDDEKAKLASILSDFPVVLRTGMSPEERERFLAAYREHPKRLSWEPILASKEDIDLRDFHRLELMSTHQNHVDAMIRSGDLKAFNDAHLPAGFYNASAWVKNSAARAYLVDHGFIDAANTEKRALSLYSEADIQAMREYESIHKRPATMKEYGLNRREIEALLGQSENGAKRSATIKIKNRSSAFGWKRTPD